MGLAKQEALERMDQECSWCSSLPEEIEERLKTSSGEGLEEEEIKKMSEVKAVECGRCTDRFLVCSECAQEHSLCDYCQHMTDKDD